MDHCLVTCLYHGLDGTVYGGRNRYTMYAESLLSIAKTGVPIHCYVFEHDYISLTSYFNERGIDNIKIVSHDILSEDFHADIMRIKEAMPHLYYNGDFFWKVRCPEIMYGKTRLMQKTIQENPHYKKIYWIDAGLSNSSIMRHKFFPLLKEDQHHISEGIFTPKFMEKLIEFTGDKIFSLLHTQPNNHRIPERYNKKPYAAGNYAMIAGLFGGDVDNILWFVNEVEQYLAMLFEHDELFSEESIYTGIVNDNPDKFSTFSFDTFYNEDWGDVYSKDQLSFASIIDKFI